MIKCIAIDDEPLALKKLVTYIKKIPFLELVAQCRSAFEAQQVLEQKPVEAIFLDINMPAVGYLLKPYGFDEFEAAAQKVKEICEIRQQSATAVEVSTDTDDGIIYVKSDYKIVRIDIDKIIYIEAMSEYLRISCEDKDKPVIVLLSMKKIEEHLPSGKFMRIHRSFIINLDKISEIKKNHVVLNGDISLPIGDNYKDAFMAYLNSKILTK